jgi:hypothetical protein
MDTLFIHKNLFLNPKYKAMGVLGYPYWFFFEWLAPIVEILGLLYFTTLAILGSINWAFFLFLIIFIYVFALNFSLMGILFMELTYHPYKKRRQLVKLMLTALIEPFIYHPMVVYWAIKGNISYLRGNRAWGVMKRSGFQ